MLSINHDDARKLFTLEPSGKLTEADFAALTEAFNAKVNETDTIPNLVIHAASFPGWADFSGFMRHLSFIRDHHRMIERIALVSDSRILDIAPRVARQFVWASIRHFAARDLQKALTWAAERDRSASHVTIMEGLPDDVIGVSLRGALSARDYAETIEPLIERKLGAHKRIKCIFRVGPEFKSMTPGAVWSDARIGVTHFSDFSKIALVSDLDWMRHATRLFAPLISAQVHVFDDDDLEEAKAWIAKDASPDD
ncbi:MAG: STAS/SEC14 domain-containing protein [Paracoccaceae bacterium]